MKALIVACILLLAVIAGTPQSIPPCEEDQAVVGSGQFEDGYWTRYECIATDNLFYQDIGIPAISD